MTDDLKRLNELADTFNCQTIAKEVLHDPRFEIWTGASKPHQHHYGKGGLARHVLEVVELCLMNNIYFVKLGKGVDPKKLFLAALFHDAGKMWDYKPLDGEYKEWTVSDHRFLIHHISRSGLIWCETAAREGWIEEDIDEVWHCILSHHGTKEWGSPVQPRNRMAWLLHLSDSISARIDDCYKRIPFSNDPLVK